jgi:uncharacterized protein YegJ (DUF2314 family)
MMMKRVALRFALLPAFAVLVACGVPFPRDSGGVTKRDGEPDVIEVEADDPEMVEAMEAARRSLSEFRAELSKNDPAAYLGLKARFEDGELVEHIWLTNVRESEAGFVGEINNEPLNLTNLRLGQSVSVPTAEVSDWFVIRDGVLRGGFTIRVLRNRMSPEEQRALDESMGATPEPLRPAA